MSEPVPVLIVDDHSIIRSALAGWLARAGDFVLVGEAANGAEAVAACAQLRPALVLMDLQMPDTDGIAATRQILVTAPDTRVLLFSVSQTPEEIHAAAEAGAWGYAPKSLERAELLAAMRGIIAGQRFFAGEIGARLRESRQRVTLSTRELEVLQHVAAGAADKEIAAALGLSVFTVKNHVAHILEKLDAPNRTRAVTIAQERGLFRR